MNIKKFRNLQMIQRQFSKQEKQIGLKGSEVVKKALEDNNIKHLFVQSGGANLPYLDQFQKSSITTINNANEQCLGHSAEGYAKSDIQQSTLGVTLTTSGPGMTNLLTPINDAKGDHVPLLCLTANVATTSMGTKAFQEVPAVKLSVAGTKWSKCVTNIEELPSIVENGIQSALNGIQGPIHIDLPKDVASMVVKKPIDIKINENITKFTSDNFYNIIEKINKCETPIIVLGQGAKKAYENIRKYAIKCNIPVTTTLHGVGIFDEEHDLSLHMLGMHGSQYANKTIQNSDLIICIGSRLDDRITGNLAKFAPKAYKAEKNGTGGIIQIINNKDEIGFRTSVTAHAIGDADHYVKELLSIGKFKNRHNWFKTINQQKNQYPFKQHLNSSPKDQYVIHKVQEVSKKLNILDKQYLATGVGNHQMFAAQFYRQKYPNRLMTSGSLGTMGSGLPFAIGTQIKNPNSSVVLIDGDGSFNMTLNDLKTVKQQNLPIKMFIMNNNRQQMVYVWQKLFAGGRIIATDHFNSNPCYKNLAAAYGIKGKTVKMAEDVEASIKEALLYDGPQLIDFINEPDICLPLVAPGKALDEMMLSPDDYEKIDISQAPC